MILSKEWNWETANKSVWTKPSEESYYYIHKWQNEGRTSILDLGCGLGRHSILFAKHGFKVTSVDLSDYCIDYLEKWKKRENVDILTKVCNMNSLPFKDSTFDCIWAYHVISHTTTDGFIKILAEIKRVLKPNGCIYFTLCSKKSLAFLDPQFKHIDNNTVIKSHGAEKNVPHYFVDLDDFDRLFHNLNIQKIRHIYECYYNGKKHNVAHYYCEAIKI